MPYADQQTRRQFCRTVATAALASRVVNAAPRLPNIVYILCDDLGWGDLHCYNAESAVPTPNADRLASQGVRFTDMHSPTALCTPTRYGILTGRYCWRSSLKNGVLNGYSPNLIEPGRLTLAAMLKSRGYYTAGIGKWHLGLGDNEKTDFDQPLRPGPLQHGFDSYFGIPASLDMPPYLYFENDRVVEKASATIEASSVPRGVYWRGGPIAPGFRMEDVLPTLAARAEAVIRERAAHSAQPFFLYLPLTAPHTPWLPKAGFTGRSKAGLYGDFVAQVDDTLGRVLRALETARVTQNTLLVFTSDNGAHWTPEDLARYPNHRANDGWRGQKSDVWDGGHRIPFLARWPGQIKPGSVSDELGCLTDFFATAAAITGASLPRDAAEDSWNLLPAYLGRSRTPIREAIVHHSGDGMFSIRQGEWKLELGLGSGGFSNPKRIQPEPGGPQGQLYNLRNDPAETRNLYLERPDVVARLTTLLEKYRAQGYSRPI